MSSSLTLRRAFAVTFAAATLLVALAYIGIAPAADDAKSNEAKPNATNANTEKRRDTKPSDDKPAATASSDSFIGRIVDKPAAGACRACRTTGAAA